MAHSTHEADGVRGLLVFLGLCGCDPQQLVCGECGPGAIMDGRVYDRGTVFGTSPTGSPVRAFSDHVQRLGSDLLPSGDPSASLAPSLTAPQAFEVAVDDTGAVTELIASEARAVVVHTDPALHLAWTVDTAVPMATGVPLAADAELVAGASSTTTVYALDARDGTMLWTMNFAGVSSVAVVDMTTLVAGNSPTAGFITAIGRDGATLWTAAFTPTGAGGTAGISSVAAGPHGEIAISGVWSGGSAALLGTTFDPPPTGTIDRMIAMLDPAGTRINWSQRIDMTYATSMVTDGTRVVAAGPYLSAAAVTAAGLEWMRTSGDEQPMWVEAVAERGIYATFDLEGAYDYGDVRGDEAGVAIVRLAP